MKALREMSKAEVEDFICMAHGVASEVPHGTSSEVFMRPALTALWIKGWKRPLGNVKL